jgi:hypothetical protein
MTGAKTVSTPMATYPVLSKIGGECMSDPLLYHSIVGALQYATITRPDIAFAVNKISQFMHNPTTLHWAAVKRTLRYLKGTLNHGITINASSDFNLHAFSDSDWAGCQDDRRSTTANLISLGPNLISWCSKKQPTVARSNTEVE